MSRLIDVARIRRSALKALACVVCLVAQSALAHRPAQHPTGLSAQVRTDGTRASVSFPVISGIGAALSITPAGARIEKVIPGSAAAHSGKLRKGDLILSIGEHGRTIPLKEKSLGEVVSLIRGPVGTHVILRIEPVSGGLDFDVALTREAVPLSGISYLGLTGKPVPNVTLMTLDGSSSVKLSKYRGKTVVLDLWASWCGACYAPLDEMQKVARAHPRWHGRVVFLAATIDVDPSAALKVIHARNWNQTIFLSLSIDEMKAMHIETIPTLLVISPAGKIVAVGDPHAISIEKEVSKLL